ncbi:MAG: hypothetical protein K2X47_19590 [Bdellovibrionales bacterium]|nr:hypothetical protein [Bdellovibrionales bacterium]
MSYEGIIDRLLIHFTGPEYRAEVTAAKTQFFEQAGIVDEDTSSFEVRMAQFLDWYLLSRENSKTHMTPIEMALENTPPTLIEEDFPKLPLVAKFRHSLFEFIKIRGSDVTIKDLFTGKKIVVENSTVTAGFNTDEIFEARIIPYQESFVFARGFCFHPPEATSFILKEIKKVKHLTEDQRRDLMLKLMKMRYKFEQYKHIRLEFIYTNDSKLRI